MTLDFMFFLNSILFGIGLAMDAFSVSLANGLAEPNMRRRKLLVIAGVFAFFQSAMPLLGWLFVHTVLHWFSWLHKLIPWISLVLLSLIGGKMLGDAFAKEESEERVGIGFPALVLQGIATSIDALSVGFTIAEYPPISALLSALLIGAVTFGVCVCGVLLGRQFGTRFSHKAAAFGGVLLILIGIEIFLTGIL